MGLKTKKQMAAGMKESSSASFPREDREFEPDGIP
jgi:hypothetical protein